jgi:Ca-activated chloride channel family protein
LYRKSLQRRSQYASRLRFLGAVAEDGSMPSGARRHLPAVLFLLGLVVLLIVAARLEVTLPVPQLEGVVMLTFDVSASMAADDVEPTRMDAAKSLDFVKNRSGPMQIGVVAFGEGGLVV